MYGVAGERRLTESSCDWLAGYEGSAPVRIGNAAHEQLQLDVYGEVMDALYQARVQGSPLDDGAWALAASAARVPREAWRSPTRASGRCAAQRRHFTHSKVMAWVAFDRAVRTVEEFGLDGPVDRWRAHARRDPRRGLRAGLRRRARRVRAVLRLDRSSTRAC